MVGESDTEAGGELRRAAFVVIDGEMRDLNEVTDLPAGYRLGVAWGINDGGQIVGTTFDNDGMEVSAWRLDPVGR